MGVGVGDNMSGLVWVMEWTSVLVIILRIPNKQNKKKKTVKQNPGKQRGRAAQQKITLQSTLFHFILLKLKQQSNDSPFRLLSYVISC